MAGMLIYLIVSIVIFVVPTWKIVEKAGYAGAWSLLSLVPLVNLVALWIFAYSTWPKEKGEA
jgi:hypothetical protein